MISTQLAELRTSENAAIVTQILDTPSGSQLHFWLGGGELSEVQDLVDRKIGQAKKQGIKKASLIGRAGWAKKLPGFKEVGRILTKEI